MKHLIKRIKLLLHGKWYEALHYGEEGFTKLYYHGVPITLRNDIPKNKILIKQSSGIWKSVDIETRRIATLKDMRTKVVL